MSAYVHVAPGSPPSRWSVRVPGSKSITNRALLLAGVASGESLLQDPLVADDTVSMAAALRGLGVQITERWVGNELQSWVVQGLGGYRWADFVRIGLLPLVVAVVLGLAAIMVFFPPAAG